nr:MAG TPA: YqzM-like protein [Caudoviricetes sp.]DAS10030.1 MAG TPA: YqzM-like protein [Caudoviricetes sp.]
MCYQKCYHDKEKNVNSQRNDVLFTWWRRWESNN